MNAGELKVEHESICARLRYGESEADLMLPTTAGTVRIIGQAGYYVNLPGAAFNKSSNPQP